MDQDLVRYLYPKADTVPDCVEEGGNPFRMARTEDLYARRGELDREFHLRELSESYVSPKEKAARVRTSFARAPTRATRVSRTAQSVRSRQPPPLADPPVVKGLNLTMGEKMKQTRDTFMYRLTIDQKMKDIRKLERTERKYDRIAEDTEVFIVERSLEQKKRTVDLVRELTTAQKCANGAAIGRLKLDKRLKDIQSSIHTLRSEIDRNIEPLEAAEMYREFLKSVTPDGEDVDKYWKDPKQLLRYFEEYEASNLALVDEIGVLEEKMDSRTTRTKATIGVIKANEAKVLEREIKKVDINGGTSRRGNEEGEDREQVEEELQHLKGLVSNSFIELFGRVSDMSVMEMLYKIETELDKYLRMCESISEELLASKQAAINRERRKIQKIEKQKQKEEEQQRKIDQAIASSQAPINKTYGRLLVRRELPPRRMREDKVRMSDSAVNDAREEAMLYGRED